MKVLVTGGGGFLGRRIVELLCERGDEVVFLARGSYPEVEQETGARGLQVDLRDREQLKQVMRGLDAVIHVAAKAGFWGDRKEYWSINVDGTRNLIDAMEEAEVKRLVYTSTPSVIGYEHEAEGIGNDAPYPKEHWSPYPESKAAAEQMVLAANSPQLATVSLRPHLIFGPRDNNLLPRVIQRAKAGRMVQVGDGTNKVDMTYVDNAAWAHLDALDQLTSHTAACAGKAYFIGNDEPVLLWDWTNDFLGQLGIPPVKRRVSLGTAMFAGRLLETVWGTFNLSGEPRLTRFLAAALARAHWYDMGPAKRDFGYHIRVDMAEGTRRTVDWFNREPDGPAAF